jgi:hypothetical protein
MTGAVPDDAGPKSDISNSIPDEALDDYADTCENGLRRCGMRGALSAAADMRTASDAEAARMQAELARREAAAARRARQAGREYGITRDKRSI